MRARPRFGGKVAAVVLGTKKMTERSDMVIVMDPRHGAQRVAAVQRLSDIRRKDGDMVMALCGGPWRPPPDEPAWDEVPVRVSAGVEGVMCQVHQSRASQRSRADVCTSA